MAQLNGNEVRLGGDIVTAVDGKKIRTSDDLANAITRKKQGDKVKIDLIRDGAQADRRGDPRAAPGDAGFRAGIARTMQA